MAARKTQGGGGGMDWIGVCEGGRWDEGVEEGMKGSSDCGSNRDGRRRPVIRGEWQFGFSAIQV